MVLARKKAVIFDMDGVISDTQKLHAEVESALLKEYGIVMTPDAITRQYAGVSDEIMFAALFEKHNVRTDLVVDVVRAKWKRMHHSKQGRIKAIPHAVPLIQKLKRDGYKLAVASASPKMFIKEILDSFGIAMYFDAIVSSKEVAEGKPAPDIFLLAAVRLGVASYEAIVIEDGKNGMLGAQAAGMACIGLVPDVGADYPATVLVSSLSEISSDMINNLPAPL